MKSRQLVLGALLAVGAAALPRLAHAQSAITGVVKDTSGAVLPGRHGRGRERRPD